jgi:multidrug efflux system outer membrane protein
VFDFGRLSARTDQVTAQQKQLLANYQRSVQNAFVDVNNALIKVRHSADMEAAAQSAVDAADATLKLANIRYQSGYSQFLEVLIAQGTYNDAWLNLIQEKRDRLLATVELYKAIGGGWQG